MQKYRDCEFPDHGFVFAGPLSDSIEVQTAYRYGKTRYDKISVQLSYDDAEKFANRLLAMIAKHREPKAA